ncbi:hypothetical protein ACN08L_16205 (plasmid) [Photobacterium leiognathi subsp. mandapamensis]|uniref:hypothetical protein n=1 Tax=Photobacterium leiognathi TaxID=553611 RepID=UPI003AF3520C
MTDDNFNRYKEDYLSLHFNAEDKLITFKFDKVYRDDGYCEFVWAYSENRVYKSGDLAYLIDYDGSTVPYNVRMGKRAIKFTYPTIYDLKFNPIHNPYSMGQFINVPINGTFEYWLEYCRFWLLRQLKAEFDYHQADTEKDRSLLAKLQTIYDKVKEAVPVKMTVDEWNEKRLAMMPPETAKKFR